MIEGLAPMDGGLPNDLAELFAVAADGHSSVARRLGLLKILIQTWGVRAAQIAMVSAAAARLLESSLDPHRALAGCHRNGAYSAINEFYTDIAASAAPTRHALLA